MNKIVHFYLIFLMILPASCFAEKVTININANVVESTCTISDGSLNKTVNLQSSDIRNSIVGAPFSGSKFSISLENCPATTSSVNIKFVGEPDPVINTLLKNTNDTASSAKGFALGLYDIDNNKIDINGEYRNLVINQSLPVNTFSFFARYIRVSETYAPGSVLSVANFELSYD